MSNSIIKSFQSYEFNLLTRQNLNTNINIRDNSNLLEIQIFNSTRQDVDTRL